LHYAQDYKINLRSKYTPVGAGVNWGVGNVGNSKKRKNFNKCWRSYQQFPCPKRGKTPICTNLRLTKEEKGDKMVGGGEVAWKKKATKT